LDEPRLLAEGLVHLALAQAEMSDQDGFLEAYRRLENLESRFGAYREAALETTIRSRFEVEAAARVEFPNLIAGEVTGGDRAPAPAKGPELTPKKRRSQLKRVLRRDPQDTGALDALARLELLEGRPRKAGPLLDRLLILQPDNREARCLRGRAWLQLGECERAVDDLEFCSYRGDQAGPAVDHLQCLVELEIWPRAAGLIGRLPGEMAEEPAIEALISRISEAGERVEPPGSRRPETKSDTGPLTAALPTPRPGPQERQELEAVRSSAAEVSRPEELADLFRRSLALSEGHPRWQEARFLAAELGYRASLWAETTRLLGDGTEIPDERPDLLFYYAVALFEEERKDEASTALQRALPRLERTPFVDRYVEKILLAPATP
jgi:tetratricopeptide (TPR) repeat protein